MVPLLRALVSLVAVASLSATPSLMAMCLAWCLPASHGVSHHDTRREAESGHHTANADYADAGHHDGGDRHRADHHGTHAAAASLPADAVGAHPVPASHDHSRVTGPTSCVCCDDAPAVMAAVNGPRTDGFAAAVAALPSPRRFDAVATFARALSPATRAPDPSPPRAPLVLRI